ncbi:MAG TPA: hypothetical protein VL359_01880 [bacterium]|nr:hypothetical protein [bacterium]
MRREFPIRGALLACALALLAMAAGCASSSAGMAGDQYNLDFSVTKFNPHNGETLAVAVVDAESGKVIAKQSGKVVDNTASFTFSRILSKGKTYYVDFYADHNKNGVCDDPPADHEWRLSVGPVDGNMTATMAHNVNFTKVCSDFGSM